MKYGIDVSHYQGSIDWQKVKATDKVDFVIIKAMYESSKNPDEYFVENYNGSVMAEIPRGAYNFIGSVSASDPESDANAFLSILNGRTLEYGIWLDLESNNLRCLGSSTIEDVILSETKIFLLAGYNVGIYCNLDWYKNVLTDKIKRIFDGKIWIARYPKSDKGKVVEKLNPQNICPESIGWQYSSKGKINGISGNVDLDMFWSEIETSEKDNTDDIKEFSAKKLVDNCKKWIGITEGTLLHFELLNIYNSNTPLPRGYAVKPTDAWCATFVSAMFIECGYNEIFPIECSCNKIIEKAIEMGIWVENDSYVPSVGDVILYDWNDNGVADCTGNADHIGIVTYVNKDSGYMVIIEGNFSDSVKKRTININGKYIRGFVTPKYNVESQIDYNSENNKTVSVLAHEVISGLWGSGEERKKNLEYYGYSYSEVQEEVNRILNNVKSSSQKEIVAGSKATKISKSLAGEYTTTENLYLRDGAGSNKKALALIPKGTKVNNYGYYSVFNNVNWLYISVTLNGVKYTGFSSSKYLRR